MSTKKQYNFKNWRKKRMRQFKEMDAKKKKGVMIVAGIFGVLIVVGIILFGLWIGGVFSPSTEATTDTSKQDSKTPPKSSSPTPGGGTGGTGGGTGGTGGGGSGGGPVGKDDNGDEDDDDKTVGSGGGGTPPSDELPPGVETRYYFGSSCPGEWTDIGKVGFIAPQSQRSNFNFEVGSGLQTGGWDWIHPKICKGTNKMKVPTGLYKLSNKSSDKKIGVIWTKANLQQISDSGATFPFEKGGDYYGSPNHQWVHPYLIPASTKGGYYFSDIPTREQIEVLDNDKSIVGPSSILWNGSNIKEASDFKVGTPAYGGWFWVDGDIRADQDIKK